MTWEKDDEGRIIEYGVVRDPDRVIVHVCKTQQEAEERIATFYIWKEERRLAAERNRAELDAGRASTNEDWWAWEHSMGKAPAIKDRHWEPRRRTVTNWEPV